MAVVIATPRAASDLAGILTYLGAEAGLLVAQKYDHRFDRFFDLLSDQPDCCPLRKHLGRGVRVGFVRPYLVIYHHAKRKKLVTIIRVVHSKRLVTRKTVIYGV